MKTINKELVAFSYRRCIKYSGRTETLVFDRFFNRIRPIHTERSRTGAHGTDYYTSKQIEKASAIVTIRISNSGKHYCTLNRYPKDKIDFTKLCIVLYNTEHICPSMVQSIKEPELRDIMLRFLEHY